MFASCFRTLVIIHVSDSFRVLLRPSLEEKEKRKKKKHFILFVIKHICLPVCLCPIRISKDEAPTPLPAVGPSFISPLLFHLSRALLVHCYFCLFRCVCQSWHNRLGLIREPALYWVFLFYSHFFLLCFTTIM